MFAECLAVWLACEGQRRLTGSGSALEALRDGIVIQWYIAPYTDNTEWYVALMLAAGVWGGVGGA